MLLLKSILDFWWIAGFCWLIIMIAWVLSILISLILFKICGALVLSLLVRRILLKIRRTLVLALLVRRNLIKIPRTLILPLLVSLPRISIPLRVGTLVEILIHVSYIPISFLIYELALVV